MGTPARPRDPTASREAILGAAETAFAEGGFAATRLSAVARAAGVTKSLIHHHFQSKEALWQEVLDRRFAEYGKRQAALLDRPDLDLSLFEASLHHYFAFLAANPDFVRLRAWANASRAQAEPVSSELVALGVERLRELQARGEIRSDVDPASVLVVFFNAVESWFQSRPSLEARFGSRLPDDSTYLHDLARVLIQGLRPCMPRTRD